MWCVVCRKRKSSLAQELLSWPIHAFCPMPINLSRAVGTTEGNKESCQLQWLGACNSHYKPICHGIFTDWSSFSKAFLLWKKGSLRIHVTNKKKLTLFGLLKENERAPVVFMAPNRASDVLAADWWFETHVKNYHKFSRLEIRFSLVVEIPIKHSSLYNETSQWKYKKQYLYKNCTRICG